MLSLSTSGRNSTKASFLIDASGPLFSAGFTDSRGVTGSVGVVVGMTDSDVTVGASVGVGVDFSVVVSGTAGSGGRAGIVNSDVSEVTAGAGPNAGVDVSEGVVGCSGIVGIFGISGTSGVTGLVDPKESGGREGTVGVDASFESRSGPGIGGFNVVDGDS